MPGQTVFTCLSHDIIAHEVTHAILDGIREYFSEATSFDTPAFHEGFADIVALFQHFSMEDALKETIQRTGGLIYKPDLAPDAMPSGNPRIVGELSEQNPLVQLGQQFGQALGMRKSLREALGTPPKCCNFQKVCEPHSRGAILVAAVFDAYFTCYVKRTLDLMRIARAHGAVDPAGNIHPDLAHRLSSEASTIAGQFLNICIRAIDYCPPVDIQFGEFLRAIITADSDLVRDDQWDYRGEFIKAFRLRGIIPEDVTSYSEEALRWWGPEQTGQKLKPCEGLIYDVVNGDDPRSESIAASNRWALEEYSQQYARELGLFSDSPGSRPRFKVHSCDPIIRLGPDGQMAKSFVVEFLQERMIRFRFLRLTFIHLPGRFDRHL